MPSIYFKVYSSSCDFTQPNFKCGADVRNALLGMLRSDDGVMRLSMSVIRTRHNDPEFGLRLIDVDGLFNGMEVTGLPMNKGDFSGSRLTPVDFRDIDLSDSNCEGMRIEGQRCHVDKGVVSGIRTNENTNLKGAHIEASVVRDVHLAPGCDARSITIKTDRDGVISGSIEGAVLEGADLPANLSKVVGATPVKAGNTNATKGYLINAADGVFMSTGGKIETFARYVERVINRNEFSHDRDADLAAVKSGIEQLTQYDPKDFPMAAQAREEVRAVLDAYKNNPVAGSRRVAQLEEKDISMPSEDTLMLKPQARTVTPISVGRKLTL